MPKRKTRQTVKVLSVCVCVAVLSISSAFARSPLANENQAGTYVKSLEQVLRLEPEEVDLATAALIVCERWSDVVQGLRYLDRLDDMAREIRKRLRKQRIPADYRAVPVINEYLFKDLGFESVADANDPNDLFLHSVMDKKRGYCLSLSILYLSLGERLGLPVHGVVVPGHFFVRYDDGGKRFNIETTSGGGRAPAKHYRDKFKVPVAYDNSIYLINLNKLQTLGCLFNNLGNAYEQIGNIESARVALERAVQINPDLAESRTNLGNIYLRIGRVNDAIEQYRAAIDINPGVAATHNNLGTAYMRSDRLHDAVREFKQCIAFDANFVDAYKNLASAYTRQERFKWAVASLKNALKLSPKDHEIHRQLGDIFSRMGNYEEAIAEYNRALQLDAFSAEAYFGLGVCYGRLEMRNAEIKFYRKALAVEPNMFAARSNLGNAYFADEDYQSAIEQYTKAVELRSDQAGILYNLGAAYFNKGNHAQAAQWYGKALELQPEDGQTHKALAVVYYKLGEYELAEKHAKSAGKLGTELPEGLLDAITANM